MTRVSRFRWRGVTRVSQTGQIPRCGVAASVQRERIMGEHHVVRGLVAACAFMVLARPAPATACSHPFACFPRVAYPATDGASAPTNAQIAIQIGTGCSPDNVELRRASDGAVITTTPEIVLGASDQSSITDDYLVADAIRLTPSVDLDPSTAYEVWGSDQLTPPDHVIRSFTTSAGPDLSDPPAMPSVTLSASLPAPDVCGEAALCCGPMTLQELSLDASNPELLYTITTDDGAVVASDLPSSSTGVAVCAGDSYVEPAAGRLWIVHGHGAVTLHVTGRDALGRAAPEVVDTVMLCPPLDSPPDAAIGADAGGGGGGGGGGGCSSSRGDGGLVLIGLAFVATCSKRRFTRDKS